tara:strand:- start:228 stop:812 length:585 start_codon:yes stop_codon:yes gene_type:complete
MNNLVLASKSKVRKEILQKNGINCLVEPSNVDEEPIKNSLLKEGASPEIVAKNLAELKANKVSQKKNEVFVIGADSVIDLNGEIISKPTDRIEALQIMKKLSGNTHHLISSVCISKNGTMVWNFTDKAELKMRELSDEDINTYLSKISDENLFAYNVYQIEGIGKSLFESIKGSENTIMGLPVEKIKEYLEKIK